MLSEVERQTFAIVIVFGVIVGYFSLAWAGVIPQQYNVIEYYLAEETNSTAFSNVYDPVVVSVTGLPTSVNLSAVSSNSYEITFIALEGSSYNYGIQLNREKSGTNVTIVLSQGSQDSWHIFEDGESAYYYGQIRYPYERTTITLAINGNEHTRGGVVEVFCTSNGRTLANTGVIHIHT